MIRTTRCLAAAWLALTGVLSPTLAPAASTLSTITYKSSVSSDANGLLDLKAELNYESTRTDAPIAVVMHGYSGSTGKMAEVRANAQRLRDAGFFVISVALRGRDSSDGVRDSGGVEIYDIFDAVERVKAIYPSRVDHSNVHITGYSGGGGNAMAALTKFPDYFRAGSSYFGMSDYGYDPVNGWYANGAESSHQSQLRTDIGNPAFNNATIEDRYMARASNLGSQNNPYSEIHLFVNQNEPTCPPVNVTSFRNNAVATATTPGEFDNINVHIGGVGQYVDFNNNGVNEATELQSWPHGYPDANEQKAAESWYLSRILNGSIPEPTLNLTDELFVGGFVKTKRFGLWLGDGQNAAGELAYDLSGEQWTFALDILSNNKNVEGTLTIDTAARAGQAMAARLNGSLVSQFVGGGKFELPAFGDNDLLVLAPLLPGDFDGDGFVDGADLSAWQVNFPTVSGAVKAKGDADGDGDVDGADLLSWQRSFTPHVDVNAARVPEPATWLLFVPIVGAIASRHRTVRRTNLDDLPKPFAPIAS